MAVPMGVLIGLAMAMLVLMWARLAIAPLRVGMPPAQHRLRLKSVALPT
jgi:hypothetical protein